MCFAKASHPFLHSTVPPLPYQNLDLNACVYATSYLPWQTWLRRKILRRAGVAIYREISHSWAPTEIHYTPHSHFQHIERKYGAQQQRRKGKVRVGGDDKIKARTSHRLETEHRSASGLEDGA
nr:PREDICTED: uncharacterized protein LOC109041568 [Bemisia tabaci]